MVKGEVEEEDEGGREEDEGGREEDDGDDGRWRKIFARGTNAHAWISKPDTSRHERHAQVPAR